MAQWLLRAIVMENVSARAEGAHLDLPAGPAFRVEKEIKNVITVVAKTCHYWIDHMWDAHQALVGELLGEIDRESPLIEPAVSSDADGLRRCGELAGSISSAIRAELRLETDIGRYSNWLGIQYSEVSAAIWMMRAMVVANVLTRREGTTLFVPINPDTDPDGQAVVRAVVKTHHLAELAGIAKQLK
jgi:hypothetical protein